MSDINQIYSELGPNGGCGQGIVRAAQDTSRVAGLTHNFYRYPARFSPGFVRSVIEALSEPGDWVFDPFAGGGTTLVEAMALGRHALGIDISSLSVFICEAKTLVVTDEQVAEFEQWRSRIPETINMHASAMRFERYADTGYYRNLEGKDFWRLRKAIEQSLASMEALCLPESRILARCAVLRTAQWALDGRKKRPSITEFRDRLHRLAGQTIVSALAFRLQIESLGAGLRPQVECLNRNTAGAHIEEVVQNASPPRLIVTSPPYPGIHVLYHRWQVDGRRETPAPFWIADKLDGAGLSHYTMGDRKNPGLRSYFEQLENSFSSIARMAGPETTVVQMVAFSDPGWQLPEYLEVMERCGLIEERPWAIDGGDGRLWRSVPNRKWHAQQKANSPSAREVVLLHRKRP